MGIGSNSWSTLSALMIVWNLVLLGLVVWFCYKQVSQTILPKPRPLAEDLANSSDPGFGNRNESQIEKKMFLLGILNDIRGISESSQTLLICLYLMVRGNKLMAIIREFLRLVDITVKFERKVGLLVTVVHLSYALVFNILQTYLVVFTQRKGRSDHKPNYSLAPMGLLFFVLLNSRLSVLSLILYLNCIVLRPLTDMANNVSSRTNLKKIYVFSSKLNDLMRTMDELLSFHNLVVLSLNSIACVSYVCSLAVGSDANRNRMAILPLIESLLQLMFLCLISDIIPKAYKELVYKLNKNFVEYSVESSACNLLFVRTVLSHMNEMRNEMSFTVYNTFRVNTNAFFSCLTLILTYSVILIQTN